MMYYFLYFIGVIILNLSLCYVMCKILNKQIQIDISKFFIIINILSIFWIINNLALQNLIRTIVFVSISIIAFKIIYKENFSKIIIATFITFIILCLAEVTWGLIAIGIFDIQLDILKETIYGQLLVNSVISLLSIIMIIMIRKFTAKEINISDKKGLLVNYGFIIISIISISYLLFKNLDQGEYNLNVLLDYLVLVILCSCIFLILKERIQRSSLSKQYDLLQEYVKTTEGVLENYRVSNHENKNQLVAIKAMVESKDKNVISYIESLLNEKMPKDVEVINNLVNISSEGLKGLMYHKIRKMQLAGIKVKINIMKDSKKKLPNLPVDISKDLFKLMGVYLDNAYDAALESKEKEVIIEGYLTSKTRSLVITNSFANPIDLDHIDEAGVTTKSKGHGYGLSLAKEIITRNQAFEQHREIEGHYYSQYIEVKIK